MLARRTFLYRNRTSFFRRRIDRCRCLDRSRCSKPIENGRKNHSVRYTEVAAMIWHDIERSKCICTPSVHLDAMLTHLQATKHPWKSLYHSILKLLGERPLIFETCVCLPTKIDASRFSGPEQFFAGAPYISVQKSNVVFSTPNRSMPMPRSIAVLENDRKRSKKS